MCGSETLFINPGTARDFFEGIMVEKGLYYLKEEYYQLIRLMGGSWEDTKHRPVVCLLKSNENENLYWAIPMGNLKHRTKEQADRIINLSETEDLVTVMTCNEIFDPGHPDTYFEPV